MSFMLLAADVADLPQAQTVLVSQGAAGQTIRALLDDLQIAYLSTEVVGFGDLDSDTGVTLDQSVQRLWRQEQG